MNSPAPTFFGQATPFLKDRRDDDRSHVPASQRLKLTSQGDSLDVQLIDYSNGGLGVRAAEPLEWGMMVGVAGVVRMGGVWMRVRGVAGVVHCESIEDNDYRIGLRLDRVEWRTATQPHGA